jgi:methyl-accepting chemotaxis protein
MTIDERVEFLIQSSESHNQQIGELTAKMGELTAKMGELTANVGRLVEVTNQDASAIRTLARIAEVMSGG